jgi:hypothetical protein
VLRKRNPGVPEVRLNCISLKRLQHKSQRYSISLSEDDERTRMEAYDIYLRMVDEIKRLLKDQSCHMKLISSLQVMSTIRTK